MNDVSIRAAQVGDVPSLNTIYNSYIVDSHVSFDTEPWTDAARRSWFENRTTAGYPVLVAERSEDVIGAAWSGPWRGKAAYDRTVETTVVLDSDAVGAGVGSSLLEALIEELRVRGYLVAIAIVALPNDASIAVHRKLGYREVGVLHGVGDKDDRRWDTMLLECDLSR